jgi:hypothetical protein
MCNALQIVVCPLVLFGICGVCPLIYGAWIPFWHFQTLFIISFDRGSNKRSAVFETPMVHKKKGDPIPEYLCSTLPYMYMLIEVLHVIVICCTNDWTYMITNLVWFDLHRAIWVFYVPRLSLPIIYFAVQINLTISYHQRNLTISS